MSETTKQDDDTRLCAWINEEALRQAVEATLRRCRLRPVDIAAREVVTTVLAHLAGGEART